MNIAVLTIFPEMFSALTDQGVSARAIDRGLVNFRCFNPRDFAKDTRRTVDDRPYGGGPGMVMMAEPLEAALHEARDWLASVSESPVIVIYMSPQGQLMQQAGVRALGQNTSNIVLIAGRYEGVDERFIDQWVDQEWSIGDYVLSGGELPAMVLIDALARIVPGALGDTNSASEDSFEHGLLDCPHYTRPADYNGSVVPDILLSGDHDKIARWRTDQALARTTIRRPDLLRDQENGARKSQKTERLTQFRKGLQPNKTEDE